MLIYNSNTALYHPPIGTVVLMLANIAITLATPQLFGTNAAAYELQYGNGLHPVQWLTSIFMHADTGHLIGNLIFMWPLGLVVEGKLGWWKFIVLYLAIGISECAIEQTFMLGTDGSIDSAAVMDEIMSSENAADLSPEDLSQIRQLVFVLGDRIPSSVGSSSAIFGLLIVCILFAPTSDFMVWLRFTTVEVPVLVVGVFYIAWEAYKWHAGGYSIGSALLHLLGVFTGLICGLICLRWFRPQVDDEDFFSIYMGKSIAATSGPSLRSKATKKTRVQNKQARKKPDNIATDAQSSGPASVVQGSTSAKQTKRTARSGDEDPALDWITGDESLPARSRSVDPIGELEKAIARGDLTIVLDWFRNTKSVDVLSQLELPKYVAVYRHLAKSKQWQAAALTLDRSLRAHPNDPASRQLQLAEICLLALKKRDQAIQLLRSIDRNALSETSSKKWNQLAAAAKRQLGETKTSS